MRKTRFKLKLQKKKRYLSRNRRRRNLPRRSEKRLKSIIKRTTRRVTEMSERRDVRKQRLCHRTHSTISRIQIGEFTTPRSLMTNLITPRIIRLQKFLSTNQVDQQRRKMPTEASLLL